ncbi:MAG TPA: hypothetical protein VG013_23305 [Gemmataceae bacterium]|jgi:hypothetical protein|nr:hypothetical protein [Gemmataceae bacterium]
MAHKRIAALATVMGLIALAGFGFWQSRRDPSRLIAGSPPQPARPASRAQADLFDPDAQHPWNRLHRQLYSRTTQAGKTYEQESLEPLFLPTSKFLTEGASHRQAIALLDEFLKERADRRIKDPVKRAVLQRDLWAVFATTAGFANLRLWERGNGQLITHSLGSQDAGDTDLGRIAQRRELQKRLVQVMRRVALTVKEIRVLPDNLAAAVKGGSFPRTYDPKHPERPFLPANLLDKQGPWVMVTTFPGLDQLSLPRHVAFTKGRSLFLVFLRLPQGRPATLAYLKTMEDGKLPQFPAGTQVALLRRTLLIDNTGTLRTTPLTERLQIRVFRRGSHGELGTGDPHDFVLSRKDLFAGRNGGLRAVGADETSYFDFETHAGDVFEMKKRPPAAVLLKTCASCHARHEGAGVVSLASIHEGDPKYPGLQPAEQEGKTYDLEAEARPTINWTRKTYTWGLLQGLWETQPGK